MMETATEPEKLCEDEGCDHFGTPHICVEKLVTTTDCTFLYFKPSGKWKYGGRGVFPRGEVTQETIKAENNGMPGITSDGSGYVLIVIPDENCLASFAYPRLLWLKEKPKCACCGATENLHEDYGSGGPYRCSSIDCVVF